MAAPSSGIRGCSCPARWKAPDRWTAPAQRPAPLRAIWSPDFGSRKIDDPELPRAAMAPDDRHQIVVKTSAFHGYEGQVSIGLSLGFGGTIAGGIGAVAGNFGRVLSPLDGPGVELKALGPLRPTAFLCPAAHAVVAGRLAELPRCVERRAQGEAFAAFPRVVGARTARASQRRWPPCRRRWRSRACAGRCRSTLHAACIIPRSAWRGGQADEDGLDLSEWVHNATQGRDHYVKIVYEGELLPFHHRAALVKVTERKFKENGGLIVANLFQRFFLVVREPVKRFEDDDRGMPFKRVEITTLVTPDIADPDYVVKDSRSFWVEVMRSPAPTDRVRLAFPGHRDRSAGRRPQPSIPMLFLSQKAQGSARQAVLDIYSDSTTSKKMADRSASVPGQKITFADRGASAADNHAAATRTLTFALAGEAPQP